jgi:D-alanyl-D-alanine carboxypeptidase
VTASYNGWAASPNPQALGGLDDRDVPGAPGVKLAPGVLAGDVATVLFDFAGKFHAHVEPLRAGQCWGFAFRPDTNNRRLLSCHASATAIDLNAPEHPNGRRGTFTPAQVDTLRGLLAGYAGVIAWGGDFTGTDDEMHFEISGTPAEVAAVAAHIHGQKAPAHHDATGHGAGFRAHLGDAGPEVKAMQHALNEEFPAYSHLAEDGVYGTATAEVVEEFSHREATDPHTPPPAGDVDGLLHSDGEDVGPRTALAFLRDDIRL